MIVKFKVILKTCFENLFRKTEKKWWFYSYKWVTQTLQATLSRIVESMRVTYVGEKQYSTGTLVWTCKYFFLSQSVYNRRREVFQPPSIFTITKTTFRVETMILAMIICDMYNFGVVLSHDANIFFNNICKTWNLQICTVNFMI